MSNETKPETKGSGADRCVKCGHSVMTFAGDCGVQVPICSDGYHGTRRCGCHCEFPTKGSVVEAPDNLYDSAILLLSSWVACIESRPPDWEQVAATLTHDTRALLKDEEARQRFAFDISVHQPDVQAADVGIPKATFELLQRQLEQIRACPSAMCCHCIEVLCCDVIPIVDSVVERLAASPIQTTNSGPCSACGDGDTAMQFHNHEPSPVQANEVSDEYKAGMRDGQAVGYMARVAEADEVSRVVCDARMLEAAEIAERDSILDWRGGSTGSAKGTANKIAEAIRSRISHPKPVTDAETRLHKIRKIADLGSALELNDAQDRLEAIVKIAG